MVGAHIKLKEFAWIVEVSGNDRLSSSLDMTSCESLPFGRSFYRSQRVILTTRCGVIVATCASMAMRIPRHSIGNFRGCLLSPAYNCLPLSVFHILYPSNRIFPSTYTMSTLVMDAQIDRVLQQLEVALGDTYRFVDKAIAWEALQSPGSLHVVLGSGINGRRLTRDANKLLALIGDAVLRQITVSVMVTAGFEKGKWCYASDVSDLTQTQDESRTRSANL